MELLYALLVSLYGVLIRLASPFNAKAAEWVKGRKNWAAALQNKLSNEQRPVIWFHCSSLGEFEQGRPVLEQLRREYPQHCLVLTFFSPSGYLQKQNEPLADLVFYLPLDGFRSSKAFLDILQPELAFFVKYEFWYYYGRQLHLRKIPFFCISAIFRPGQIFFRPWGAFFKKILTRYSHIFVQDQASLELLYRNSIPSVTVSGDTRFDRVLENRQRTISLPAVEKFCVGKQVMVAGSTWPADEKVLRQMLKDHDEVFLILAPHETDGRRIAQIERIFAHTQRYSVVKADAEVLAQDTRVLIIDSIGLLSQLYRYGKCCYVGGGFGKGIHNILEAAVYGKPVFFGPNYTKFKEARDLKAFGGGIPVKSGNKLTDKFGELMHEDLMYEELCRKNRKYIEDRKGATEILMNYLRLNYPPGY